MADKLPAYTNTDTVIRFPVSFAAGSGVTSAVGAVFDLRVVSETGGAVTVGSTVLQTSGGSEFVIGTFPAYTLTKGSAKGQLWAEKTGQKFMLAEFALDVRVGFRPPQ